jgi:hypothetical protein
MTRIPRGRYIGKLLGDPPESEAEHFIRCPACCGWSIAAILLKSSSTKGRYRIRRRIGRNKGCQQSARHARNMGAMMVTETDHETA